MSSEGVRHRGKGTVDDTLTAAGERALTRRSVRTEYHSLQSCLYV